jgi:hypothetical protein
MTMDKRASAKREGSEVLVVMSYPIHYSERRTERARQSSYRRNPAHPLLCMVPSCVGTKGEDLLWLKHLPRCGSMSA